MGNKDGLSLGDYLFANDRCSAILSISKYQVWLGLDLDVQDYTALEMVRWEQFGI